VKAVNGVSFTLDRDETLGIVGESGSGKTVTAMSLMRLIPDPPGRIVGGSIVHKGRDLLAVSKEEMSDIRGNDIAMIFQDPMTSLNPVFKVGDQIAEVIAPSGQVEARVLEDGHRTARQGRHPRPRQARRSVSRSSSPAACASAP
jgi:oligopeptide transport system ATP-binding protein